jgi:hypothetical protein
MTILLLYPLENSALAMICCPSCIPANKPVPLPYPLSNPWIIMICFLLVQILGWVSEWLLFNAKWTIFQLDVYKGESKLHFDELMMSALY